jgi:hypothetical protein
VGIQHSIPLMNAKKKVVLFVQIEELFPVVGRKIIPLPDPLEQRSFFSTLPIKSGWTPRDSWQTFSPFRWQTRDLG